MLTKKELLEMRDAMSAAAEQLAASALDLRMLSQRITIHFELRSPDKTPVVPTPSPFRLNGSIEDEQTLKGALAASQASRGTDDRGRFSK